jgi:anti-sigma factor RsiW
MMNCDWTSKISSLIDGELAPAESARMQAHMQNCAACQRTQEDFLLLRRQLASYQTQTTPFAQQRALQNILANGATAASISQKTKDAPPRPGLLESLSLIFNAQRLTPARMSALALVLFAITLGLFAYLRSHSGPSRESIAQANNAPASLTPSPVSPVKDQESASGGGVGQQDISAQPNNNAAGENGTGGSLNDSRRTLAANGTGARVPGQSLASSRVARRVEIARERRLPVERRLTPDAEVVPGIAPDNDALSRAITPGRRFDLALSAGDPETRTARYVEQAQLLLRSFRNARPNETGPAFDVAHEKQRSQKLLYQNIVLRREAASTGNVPVEKLLSSLEPILIDIANLPDNPAQDDVRSIRERMQRKNIVAILQVNSASATRSN